MKMMPVSEKVLEDMYEKMGWNDPVFTEECKMRVEKERQEDLMKKSKNKDPILSSK